MTTYSVFGASLPGTSVQSTAVADVTEVIFGTAFDVTAAGKQLAGARLYVPSGSALIGQAITLGAWVPSTVGAPLTGTPTASGNITSAVSGWNEVTFASPVTLTSGGRILITYRTTTPVILTVIGAATTAIASSGGGISLSPSSAPGMTPTGRSTSWVNDIYDGWVIYGANPIALDVLVQDAPASGGVLNLTGSSAMTFTATPAPEGSLALNGSGVMVSSAGNGGAINLAGSSSMTFAAAPALKGTLTLGGSSTEVFAAAPAPKGALALAGLGAMTLVSPPVQAGFGRAFPKVVATTNTAPAVLQARQATISGPTGQVTVGNVALILSVTFAAAGRMRLYRTAAERDSDLARDTSTVYPPDNTALIYDFFTDGPIVDPLTIAVDARPGAVIYTAGAGVLTWVEIL